MPYISDEVISSVIRAATLYERPAQWHHLEVRPDGDDLLVRFDALEGYAEGVGWVLHPSTVELCHRIKCAAQRSGWRVANLEPDIVYPHKSPIGRGELRLCEIDTDLEWS